MATNGAIKTELLVKNVIARAPCDIKAILNDEAYGANSWFEFKKGAEGATWIAFPERIVQRVEKYNPQKQFKKRDQRKQTEAYCLIYGAGNHFTRQCRDLRKKEEFERGKRKKNGNANVIESEEQEPSENDNFIQTILGIDTSLKRNPFFINIYNGSKKNRVLLDTGADVSVINKKYVSPDHKLFPNNITLKSACGGKIRTCGSTGNFKLMTDGGVIDVDQILSLIKNLVNI